jgi:hypothetical protein
LITGARLSVDGRAGPHAVTNAGGEFALAGLAPGTLTLKIETAAGAATLVPIQVPSDSYDIVAD